MAATPSHRQLTVADRPGVLAKTFWELAGKTPDARDPIAVASAAARALEALERTDHGPHVTAATLTFLLRLDGDRIYAAPEQTRGDATSQRSLVFTVGVLVFEKLTGQHPFGATVRGRSEDGAADEKIPPELRATLDTAMAPFPADRWSSLRALRGELERIVERDRSLVVEMRRARRRSVPPPCPGSAVRRFARGSRPAPIPNAPARADTHDDEELLLDRRPSSAPVVERAKDAPAAPVRAAIAPAATVAATASTVSTAPRRATAEALPMVDVALLESKPWHALARALVLMSVGAGLALTAVWLVQRPFEGVDGAAPRERTVAVKAPVELPGLVIELQDEEAAVTGDDASGAAPVTRAPVEPPAAEDTASAAGAPVEAPVAADGEPAVFDVDRAGEAALAAIRECFDEDRQRRGVELSLSLRFRADDGLSDRVYFAPAQVLDDDERSCVRERLTGLSGGAAPERHSIASFTFWLSPQRTRFWAKAPR